MVTEEAIRDFAQLSTRDRLAWLDQARTFLDRTLPAKQKRIFEMFRQGKI